MGLIISEAKAIGAAKQQKAHEDIVFLKNSLLSFLIKASSFMVWM
jgi:hypothetical protein